MGSEWHPDTLRYAHSLLQKRCGPFPFNLKIAQQMLGLPSSQASDLLKELVKAGYVRAFTKHLWQVGARA